MAYLEADERAAVSDRTALIIQLVLMFGLVAIGYGLGRLWHGRA